MGSAEVDAYVQSFPPVTREALQAARTQLLAAIPDSDEAISYKIIGLKSGGKYFLYISGWKDHCSIHATSPATAEAMVVKYPQLTLKGRTLHFQPEVPLGDDLIEDLVRLRLAELA